MKWWQAMGGVTAAILGIVGILTAFDIDVRPWATRAEHNALVIFVGAAELNRDNNDLRKYRLERTRKKSKIDTQINDGKKVEDWQYDELFQIDQIIKEINEQIEFDKELMKQKQ